MRASLFSLASLASLALGAPSLTLKRENGATATQAELDKFKLYAQWAAAASCNSEKSPGEPIACQEEQCTTLESHQAVVAGSFTGLLTDSRGFVGIDHVDKVIVLSFRGSVSVRNWIADLILIQVPCTLTPFCLVHAGFLASYNEIAKPALAALASARAANPTYRVVTTGYSLGAAVATLAAANLRKSSPSDSIDLITFGSPRVGNGAFAKFVTGQKGEEYRLTHKDDPVPRLPPIIFNYRHTSPEYWFDPGSDKEVSLDEVQVCLGHANISCNAATEGLNMDTHGWYFQGLAGCYPESMPFKRDEASDAELAAKLTEWAREDVALAANLVSEGEFDA
ncbi:Alpha/Beta hydrolase protein [Podospora australis]|uniref:Alpha/Beta hydrolase protein n=1 Tax=Podospora australis TaxID=1536484 RepID=A0AAN7AJU8_9PEZI|nr:Alpha/Beta hydrolase protein [Podospora australis]